MRTSTLFFCTILPVVLVSLGTTAQEKGDRSRLPVGPKGCCAQTAPVPFRSLEPVDRHLSLLFEKSGDGLLRTRPPGDVRRIGRGGSIRGVVSGINHKSYRQNGEEGLRK